MVISGIIIKISKEVFQRARPLSSIINETNFTFPSGHATITVVFLGLITYLFYKKESRKQMTIVTISLIFLIGFTRIYLRVHWFTDIIAGFILGGIILFTSTRLLEHYRKVSKFNEN
jgi:undecaprenyl-diphosphatase